MTPEPGRFDPPQGLTVESCSSPRPAPLSQPPMNYTANVVVQQLNSARRIMSRAFLGSVVGLVALALAACGPSEPAQDRYDLIVQGGRVMVPASGLDAIRNVGIRDGRIAVISESALEGDQQIDAAGLVVAPGFIDLHAHLAGPAGSDEILALRAQDGVTSAFELELGAQDIAAWYGEREGGQILNYGVSIGHIPVRMKVMGDSGRYLPTGPGGREPAEPEQIAEMERMIEAGLAEGALGVGFGLAYTPAASRTEFESMLQIAAEHGVSAHIHLRDGIDGLKEAIEGAANTGASLHVVHVNSSGGADTGEYLKIIEQARSDGQDVTTEAYPYEASATGIGRVSYDDWESWNDDSFSTFEWPQTGERLTRESFGRYRARGGLVIHHTRTEEMTRTAIEHTLTMIASDAVLLGGFGHPRTAGTNAKVLGKYVREEGVLTLMDALRRVTIEPAGRLEGYVPAMRTKGRLAVGADADVTIFDAATVIDRATYANPALPSEGILYVLVNGEPVVKSGSLIPDSRPGQAVRRQ